MKEGHSVTLFSGHSVWKHSSLFSVQVIPYWKSFWRPSSAWSSQNIKYSEKVPLYSEFCRTDCWELSWVSTFLPVSNIFFQKTLMNLRNILDLSGGQESPLLLGHTKAHGTELPPLKLFPLCPPSPPLPFRFYTFPCQCFSSSTLETALITISLCSSLLFSAPACFIPLSF